MKKANIKLPRVQVTKAGVSRLAIVGAVYAVEMFNCGSMRKLSNTHPSAKINNFFLDNDEYNLFIKEGMMKTVID